MKFTSKLRLEFEHIFPPLVREFFRVQINYIFNNINKKQKTMPLKPGPKRIATSTGKPDQRQRDNKNTPGNTPSLKPPKRSSK